MSASPNNLTFPCPFCNESLEVAAADVGKLAPCPHCGEEIPLEKPVQEDFAIKSSNMAQYQHVRNRSAAHAAASGTTPELQQLIKVGYLLAIVLPLVGFFFGFYLMFKNRPTEGVVCMVLSLVFSVI